MSDGADTAASDVAAARSEVVGLLGTHGTCRLQRLAAFPTVWALGKAAARGAGRSPHTLLFAAPAAGLRGAIPVHCGVP